MKADRRYVMILRSDKEMESYREAARKDGFTWVATWFRWLGLERIKGQGK